MKKRLRALVWVFPLLVASGIFFFSAQPGDDSVRLSNGFIQNMLTACAKIKILQGMNLEKVMQALSIPIRKGAHVTEYMVLYLSLLLSMYVSKLWKYRWVIFSMAITFLYACTDEFHQTFVPGRAGRFTDVMIDCAGALVMCIIFLCHMKKRKTGTQSRK